MHSKHRRLAIERLLLSKRCSACGAIRRLVFVIGVFMQERGVRAMKHMFLMRAGRAQYTRV